MLCIRGVVHIVCLFRGYVPRSWRRGLALAGCALLWSWCTPDGIGSRGLFPPLASRGSWRPVDRSATHPNPAPPCAAAGCDAKLGRGLDLPRWPNSDIAGATELLLPPWGSYGHVFVKKKGRERRKEVTEENSFLASSATTVHTQHTSTASNTRAHSAEPDQQPLSPSLCLFHPSFSLSPPYPLFSLSFFLALFRFRPLSLALLPSPPPLASSKTLPFNPLGCC